MKLIAHIITYFLPNADPILVAYWLALAILLASVVWTKLRSQALRFRIRYDELNHRLQHPSNSRATGLEVSCQ